MSKTFAKNMFGTYDGQQQDEAALSKLTAFDLSFEAKNISLPKSSESIVEFDPAVPPAVVSLPVQFVDDTLLFWLKTNHLSQVVVIGFFGRFVFWSWL